MYLSIRLRRDGILSLFTISFRQLRAYGNVTAILSIAVVSCYYERRARAVGPSDFRTRSSRVSHRPPRHDFSVRKIRWTSLWTGITVAIRSFIRVLVCPRQAFFTVVANLIIKSLNCLFAGFASPKRPAQNPEPDTLPTFGSQGRRFRVVTNDTVVLPCDVINPGEYGIQTKALLFSFQTITGKNRKLNVKRFFFFFIIKYRSDRAGLG